MAATKRARLDPIPQCYNWIGGEFVQPSSGAYLDVKSPTTGAVISRVALSNEEDVAIAVRKAKEVFDDWKNMTCKMRAGIMFRFHELLILHADELADLIVQENGKNFSEALASVAKANETVEWACSLPQLMQGKILQVSRGITCYDTRDPVGIVASIVPFNFPIMVPMWTVPIALTAGNCVILKPSEKVPMTMQRVAELLHQAGVPSGVFQLVNGAVDAVNAICDHPEISAVSFVGSSKVAELVAKRCRNLNKRVLALGGAKNHLVALPDCDTRMASQDIVASFAGCSGQRCMAASVLLLVGDCGDLLTQVMERARALAPGVEAGQVGPVIDEYSKQRILSYINEAESNGAQILLDGRTWIERTPGNWIGPTIILHTNSSDRAMREEVFGPVLSVMQVGTPDEAIAIENSNPFGNAACIYTSMGGNAEWFTSKFRAGMIGVNIGIPVPREPFSFGGLYGTLSKFGDMDITGDGCLEFFTNRRKVTSKWTVALDFSRQVPSTNQVEDRANFNGQL